MENISSLKPDVHLREMFLYWQCKIRQMAMREHQGRPDSAVTAKLKLAGVAQSLRKIIVVLSKIPEYSSTPEMKNIVKSTHDPFIRLEKGLELFSEKYFSNFLEFSDTLTATFSPNSNIASAVCAAEACNLTFEGYGKEFELYCCASKLSTEHHLFQATWWHNQIFNSHLHPETLILSFKPNWKRSRSISVSN